MTNETDRMQCARQIAEIVADKRGTDIVGLDVAELVGYTDALIVCTALNERQAKAIADEVRLLMKDQHGLLPSHVEGETEARWVLLDYLDCVLHIFVPEARDRYRLEQLWGEAPAVDLGIPEPSPDATAAGA